MRDLYGEICVQCRPSFTNFRNIQHGHLSSHLISSHFMSAYSQTVRPHIIQAKLTVAAAGLDCCTSTLHPLLLPKHHSRPAFLPILASASLLYALKALLWMAAAPRCSPTLLSGLNSPASLKGSGPDLPFMGKERSGQLTCILLSSSHSCGAMESVDS